MKYFPFFVFFEFLFVFYTFCNFYCGTSRISSARLPQGDSGAHFGECGSRTILKIWF